MSKILIQRRGLMLVLSSPSGAGKTTLSRLLVEHEPALTMSVSVTTRPKRKAEIDGRDYHFISRAEFDRMVKANELLEHAQVFDHYYGTPAKTVYGELESGRDVLFDIDWQGTQQLQERAANDLVRVFLLPPSAAELERRLKSRGQDAPEVVAARMAKMQSEISHYPEYDYVVINENVEQSLHTVRSILHAERNKRSRQIGLSEFVQSLSEEKSEASGVSGTSGADHPD